MTVAGIEIVFFHLSVCLAGDKYRCGNELSQPIYELEAFLRILPKLAIVT
jgi:hypothetical protein